MSSSPRLSEMIGIDSRHREEPSWPLNIVLLALGGVVIWVAFKFLRADDPRLQYNPWSYVVVTPVVLLGLSLVLRNITSRGVERSLQIGFLLSLLLHLLLSMYAGDVVVFTRMWPEIFEELAQERKVLERQSQLAPRYHNLAASKSAVRPDYLRHVPTTHKPTEVKDASEEALQLAMSHKTELVSPKPNIQKSPTPHLVPRERSQLPPPQANDRVAALSRSESRLPKPTLKSPESLSIAPDLAAADAMSPEPMRPSETSETRGRTSGATLRNEFNAAEKTRAATTATMERRDVTEALPLADTRIAKPRADNSPVQARRGSIDVPDSPNAATEVTAGPLLANDQSSRTSPTVRDSILSMAEPSAAPKLTPNASKNNQLSRRADRDMEMRVPMPAAGDLPTTFARESAGGRVGAAAPRSLPIQGLDSLAMPNAAEPDVNSAMSSLALRNSQIQRSTSGLPALGLPQSAIASNSIGITGGTDANSNAALPQRAGQGSATAEDVAGLSGAGRSIQKSTVGTAGITGAIQVPSGDAYSSGESSAVVQLSPSESGTGRGTQSNPSYGAPGMTGLPGEGAGSERMGSSRVSGIPEGLTRPSNSFTPSTGEAMSGIAGSSMERKSTSRSPQSRNSIEVPEATDLVEEASPGDLQAADGSFTDGRLNDVRSRSDVSTLLQPSGVDLDIKAELGRGGLADLNRDGVIVPRTGRMFEPIPLMEIDSQRFSRQSVGGPLAAGNSIPLPKPAFKQRLDRLKENQAADDSAWGPQTEQAIEAGLEFLSKHQSESGAWRLQDFDTQVLIRSDTAATALSLLSFQGAGYTHQQYQYAQSVGKALDFLVKNQQPNGDLYKREDPASDQNAWLYSHAIASLALCEAYGMTQDPALREPAQKAINFMVESQDKQRGGWRYRPGNGTDTSVSGWFMMAFKSGQLAGLDVPAPTFQLIEQYLDQSQASKTARHLYRYNPFAADTPEQRHGREVTPVMTSAGLLMRLYFGWQRGQAEMTAGADYLLEHPPAPGTKDATLRDTYYWYYSTQVLFHMGGERWKKWNATLYPMLIQTQVTEGPNAGSWDPYQPTADLWAKYGGRLYVTTLNLLSLEVNYRHLPLYDATAK